MGKAQKNLGSDNPVLSPNDEELVLTPGGWRPKSKVSILKEGQHISGKGGRMRIIETATGKEIKDLGPTSTKKRREHLSREEIQQTVPALSDIGWIENSQWQNTSGKPIVYFSSTWVVPPVPASDDDQIIFLFNGLQPADGSHILQPVLQWGAANGTGKYWSVTNWYANGEGGHAITKTPVQVNPGDVLQGIMTLTGQSGSEFSYHSSFVGYSSVDIDATDINELTWAYETLEAYGSTDETQPVPQCSDYPDIPLTAFYDIEIKVGTSAATGTEATINWGTNVNYNDCGQQCVIVSNDSPGGSVYIYYKKVQQSLYFVTDKSTFGKDEVSDVITSHGGMFPNAFWLILEGFTIDQLTVDQPAPVQPSLTGDFKNFGDVIIKPNIAGMEPESPGDLYTPQRIRFPFDIQFTGTDLFPTTNIALQETLQASINIAGTLLHASTSFELVSGEDPYFTNIDSNGNVYYLSQDLRVFSVASGDPAPLGGPAFSGDPYTYIQSLLGYLNSTDQFTIPPTPPSNFDPLNSLPGQTGYETSDSSVTPTNSSGQTNYNFAIARVRLQDVGGATANNVRVFFRLFVAQSCDTDFQPNTTYQTITDASGTIIPIASGTSSATLQTIPFFATGNADNDYNGSASNGNIQNILIPVGQDSVWKYYGCYLDVYNGVFQSGTGATHHCIVAEINYDGTPITNSSGITQSPENSDKLAQRNLQITLSGNPSYPLTHCIPQAFDTRSSQPVSAETGSLLNYPDELMVDWGNVPANSIANIFWPEVNASDVLQLASNLYSTDYLLKSDANTIQCRVINGITYIPIPSATGKNFAGLFTIELPNGITVGQEFNIKVRRITSRVPPPVINIEVKDQNSHHNTNNEISMSNWRYVTGTFQIKIPVEPDVVLGPLEENILSVLKWRQQNMSPLNRWFPVLQRYIQYVKGRVNGAGGDANAVVPSLTGIVPPECTDKIEQDCECTCIKNRCIVWLAIAIVPWIAFWVFTIWAAMHLIAVGSLTLLGLIVLIVVFIATLLTSLLLIKNALTACGWLLTNKISGKSPHNGKIIKRI